MANIRVKNKNVFNPISCSCSSYLCHWENYANSKAKVCSVLGCSNTDDLVGGHVLKCHGNSNNSQYIVPLCHSCNSIASTECFDLKSGVVLVPVAERTNCKPCN